MGDVLDDLTPLELDALRLRAWRRRLSLDMEDLSERSSVHKGVIGAIEACLQCKYRNMGELSSLARALHRPVEDIFPGYIEYICTHNYNPPKRGRWYLNYPKKNDEEEDK